MLLMPSLLALVLAADPAPSQQQTASAALAAALEAADQGNLPLDPQGAIVRGDLRFADQFGDYITADYIKTLEEKTRKDLASIVAIPRDQLPENDRIAYDVFRYQTEFDLRGYETGIPEISFDLPLDQLFGRHLAFPDFSSGTSFAPFNTLADYENGLKRLDGFVVYLDRTIVAMRRGIRSGRVQPRIVTERVIGQLDAAIAAGVDGSPLIGPTKTFPKEISEADAERLRRQYREAVEKKTLPAYRRLRAFMAKEYLPKGRVEKPGLAGMPGGQKLYSYAIEQFTTTRMDAAEIHKLGLSEVARIRAEMETIKTQVGFKGSLKELFDFLRTDPRFKFSSVDALLGEYGAIRKRVEAALPKLFATLPKHSFEVRPMPPAVEGSGGGAYYNPGTPDGSRLGVFFANTSNLPSRTSPRMESLFLHEAVPGHHLQGRVSVENEALPATLRFGYNTAYGEGWALYAESLGPELGLFTDPYQRFGHLDLAMLRALRLVVDTGLHANGWSREKAIGYMVDNSSLTEDEARQEVERYIVWAGQALAYKVGELTIRRLRTEAEKELGARFDVRAFHTQVLDTGALPLAVLESKVRRWIAKEKSR